MYFLKQMRFFLSASIVALAFVLSLVGTVSTLESTGYKVPYNCTCDCFDRQFKGSYFRESSQYRSIYFNMEKRTAYIVAMTIFYILLLFKYVDKALLALFKGKLNFLVLICSSIGFFSHFYNWWTTLNYINDRFYIFWYSQWFFNITELIPASSIYVLLDNSHLNEQWKNISLGVLVMHLYQCMIDQGIAHLILNQNFQLHLYTRDIIFVVADGLTFLAISYKKKWSLNDLFLIVNYALLFKIVFNIWFYEAHD